MGVTLYYKGKLKTPDLIPDLVKELEEISNVNGWQNQVITPNLKTVTDKQPKISGIVLSPEKSEPVAMTFDEDGNLISLLALYLAEQNEEPLEDLLHTVFVKTQFAGPKYHVKLCNLLKYLSNKYFSDFECKDDSGYYETGDETKLLEVMSTIDRMMDSLDDAFSMHSEDLKDKSPEEIKDFIGNVLKGQPIEIQHINFDEEE